MKDNLKEHLFLFLTHYDDYLDIILELSDDKFGIRPKKLALKKIRDELTIEEYNSMDADIFIFYLTESKII